MIEKILMSVLIAATLAAFGWRINRLIHLLRLGRDDDRSFADVGRRTKDWLMVVLAQRKLLQWTLPGLEHFFIFWGFIVLFTTIVEAFGAIYVDRFALPLIGAWGPLGALQDFFIAAVFAGVVTGLVIRRIQRPGRYSGSHNRAAEGILYAIAGIMVFITLSRALEAALGTFPYDTAWTPLTAWVAGWFEGFSRGTREALDTAFLWIHSLLILGFLVYITYSKHLHIVTAVFNVALRSDRPKGALKPMHIDIDQMTEDDVFGAAKITDLTWKQILDGYTCTECGRCQSQCPAWNTSKPLSPKLLIMDMRDAVFAYGPELLKAKQKGEEAFTAALEAVPPLNPDIVEDEVVWDCTTCGACVQACPVDIEHIDAIIDMRRNLVMGESRFPREMQGALQNLETTGNPWGQPPQARTDWTRGTRRQEQLEIPLASENPDAEVLFWVGCAGAFDDRNKKVVYDFAWLMQIAGVNFAILGPEESCTGDPARRMGAEYIAQMLAEQNIETLNGYGVKKIVCTCPHCFNMLFNEYPQFGGIYEVMHHSEYLGQLVREGRLKPEHGEERSITYHDPCYLARHNDVTEGARRVIESIPGSSYKELHRHGHSTFCCGAGGGRMWMEERMGKKINIERTDEALASASDTLAVSCPYCNIMLSDGVTERGAGDRMAVRDVAQLLLESIELHPDSSAGKRSGNGHGAPGTDTETRSQVASVGGGTAGDAEPPSQPA